MVSNKLSPRRGTHRRPSICRTRPIPPPPPPPPPPTYPTECPTAVTLWFHAVWGDEEGEPPTNELEATIPLEEEAPCAWYFYWSNDEYWAYGYATFTLNGADSYFTWYLYIEPYESGCPLTTEALNEPWYAPPPYVHTLDPDYFDPEWTTFDGTITC